MLINYGKCGIGKINLELKVIGKCSRCRKENAIINIRYANQRLCKDCFNEFFINRVRRTVESFKMFKPDERVAVAVSGGKDSVALLHALKLAFPKQDIYAFYINLGIRYYSDHLQKKVIELAESLKVPLEIYDLRDEGYTIDDFMLTKYGKKMCSVCGTIKRNIFTKLAMKVKADAVATGHNLDDTVSTMLSLFFAGDFEGIARLKPVLKPLIQGQPRKIKPLITTPEVEDLYYVALNELPVQECGCPHGEFTPIKGIKRYLDMMEEEQPDIKFRLLSVFRKKFIPLIDKRKETEEKVVECKICGMPSSNEICSKCRRVMELMEIKKGKEEKFEVSFEEVESMMKEGNVILLDVRDKNEYEVYTLEGAINIPADEIEKRWKELKRYRKTHKIVVFCNSGRASYSVSMKLRNLGFKSYNLKGGILSVQSS